MAKKVQIDKVVSLDDKEWLGKWPVRTDVEVVYDEDVDVYLPNGALAVVYRRGVLKSTLPIEEGGVLTVDNYDYWKWVSRALCSDQRGYAAGKDIVTNPDIRLTKGQVRFIQAATRSRNPLVDEVIAREMIQDTAPDRNTYYIKKVADAGLVDVEEIEKWDKIVRKKNVDPQTRQEAIANRNKAKLAWFYNWFETVWVPAEDRAAVAKEARKKYVTTQPRGNRSFSNVLGAIDRSGRMPYGRLTKTTTDRYEDFAANAPFYHEVNELMKVNLPEAYKVLNDRFSVIKDERCNLFGTAFTTLTVNNNFQVAYHRDGNNAVGAVAALAVMEKGDWEGGEFVFPELKIGFQLRKGDILIGDNQGLIHGMLPFSPSDMEAAGAENIMFVFYQRDNIVKMDDLDCEECRRQFMLYNVEHNQHHGTGEPLWSGIYKGMWTSPEWTEFKKMKNMEHCSNTNYWCT